MSLRHVQIGFWRLPGILRRPAVRQRSREDLRYASLARAVIIQVAGSCLKVLLLPSLDTATWMVSTSVSPSPARVSGRLAAALKSRV